MTKTVRPIADVAGNRRYILDEDFYKELIKDQHLLTCLQNNGVDNWQGWDDAIDEYNEMYGEDE
tara:strand:- start:397 stop:588 length:192 start_codon:yes stop_codon:yes gene_type:complete